MSDAEIERPGFTMIDALLLSPQAAFTSVDSHEVHRVEIEGLPLTTWGEADYATAVCGAQVKLVRARWKDVRTQGTRFKRCKACRLWRRAALAAAEEEESHAYSIVDAEDDGDQG